MRDTLATKIAAFCILLSMAAEFTAIGISFAHGGAIEMTFDSGQRLTELANSNWLAILISFGVAAPVLSMVAWPAMYQVLASGGSTALPGVIISSFGMLIGVIAETIRLGAGDEVASGLYTKCGSGQAHNPGVRDGAGQSVSNHGLDCVCRTLRGGPSTRCDRDRARPRHSIMARMDSGHSDRLQRLHRCSGPHVGLSDRWPLPGVGNPCSLCLVNRDQRCAAALEAVSGGRRALGSYRLTRNGADASDSELAAPPLDRRPGDPKLGGGAVDRQLLDLLKAFDRNHGARSAQTSSLCPGAL